MLSRKTKLAVGLSSVSALHGAMWVAEQRGLFRKHGIDTEIIVTGQGGTTGIGALLANDIQIASAGGDSLVNAALRGGETVMIAAGVNRGLNRIMVRPDIKTPADLKGKKIGATRIGAVSHSVLDDDAKTLEHEPGRRSGASAGIVAEHAPSFGQEAASTAR